MAFELITVACLSDNYAFLMHDAHDGTTLLVDVPEAFPILDVVSAKGWNITHILLTHHHPDHVQGLPDILANHRPIVIGAKADAHRLICISPFQMVIISQSGPPLGMFTMCRGTRLAISPFILLNRTLCLPPTA